MDKTRHGWDVLDEEAGVLSYEYTFTKHGQARCMSVRLKDGTLALISPPCRVDDGVMEDLTAFGMVSALIAPNGFHWLGLEQWSRAFPEAQLYAPEAAAKRIAKKAPRLKPFKPLSELEPKLAEGSHVFELPGVKIGETWLTATGSQGAIWYVSDSFFSMSEAPGHWLPRLLFSLTKSAPGFRVNGLGMKMFVRNKRQYRNWLGDQLEREAPRAVVTAHGDVVLGDVSARMREAIDAALH